MPQYLITNENNFLDLKSTTENNLMVIETDIYMPPVDPIVLPTTPADDNITGVVSMQFDAANGYLTGIAALPNEQYFYIAEQSNPQFYIFDGNGLLYRMSDKIPNYSSPGWSNDAKVWINNDYEYIYFSVDGLTIGKYDLMGNYINHYTYNTENKVLGAITEADNGDIYIAGRYQNGIIVLNSNMTLKFSIATPSIDGVGITIVNDIVYVADYSSGTNGLVSMNLDGSNQQWLGNFEFLAYDVKPSSDNLYLYVVDYSDVSIRKFEITTGTFISRIPFNLSGRATSVWVNPNGESMYTTLFFNDENIYRID